MGMSMCQAVFPSAGDAGSLHIETMRTSPPTVTSLMKPRSMRNSSGFPRFLAAVTPACDSRNTFRVIRGVASEP